MNLVRVYSLCRSNHFRQLVGTIYASADVLITPYGDAPVPVWDMPLSPKKPNATLNTNSERCALKITLCHH